MQHNETLNKKSIRAYQGLKWSHGVMGDYICATNSCSDNCFVEIWEWVQSVLELKHVDIRRTQGQFFLSTGSGNQLDLQNSASPQPKKKWLQGTSKITLTEVAISRCKIIPFTKWEVHKQIDSMYNHKRSV